MHHDAMRNVLMLTPLAVAVLVAAAVPGMPDGAGKVADGDTQHAVYARCRAETAPLHAGASAAPPTHAAHAAQAAQAAQGPRTQSPAWVQQREAALQHCLQAALGGGRQASAR